MKRLIPLLLLLAFGASQASALDRRPRSRKRPVRSEQPAPAAVPAAAIPAAATAENPEPRPDRPEEPAAEAPHPLTDLTPEAIDSLLAAWRERQSEKCFESFFDQYVGIDSADLAAAAAADKTPDSVYVRRLRDLVSPVPLSYNYIVRGYIDRYTAASTGTISRMLGLSKYYFPMIEEELIRQGLPVELRALPIIESALSPTAISPMGAAGLWQFMPATGKVYGLEINSLVDERCDPVRATSAACRYLADLHALYGDWTLAIAAYNCGPGNVNKAIARAGGGKRSFWDIYDFLPRETRGYVPAFIGATYAYAYHELHGIECTDAPLPLATDTLRIDRLMHLGQVASTIDLPIEVLRQLNPQYRLDIIPATTKPYTLVLPQRYVARYIERQDSIFAKDSAYLKEYIDPANIEKKRQERRLTIYVVKRGDTLGAIARRYRVTTAQLMRWNGIKNPDRLRLGQRLRIEGR